jgi:hypothetical protein
MNSRGVDFRRFSDLALTCHAVAATLAGRMVVPRPCPASCASMAGEFASNAIDGEKPATSQASSRQARRPVPRGRLISGRSRRSLSRITDRPAHASSYPTAHQTANLVDDLTGTCRGRERVTRERKDGRPGVGQPNRSSGPVKQLLAQLTFELANLSADPGLSHMQPLSGLGETCLVDYRDEVLKVS